VPVNSSAIAELLSYVDITKETLDELPLETRTSVVQLQKLRELRRRLDDPSAPISERFDAYLMLATCGRSQYRQGKDMPNLTRLGLYLSRNRTSVRDMRTAVRVDRANYDLLLCLAAIYPAPVAGQSMQWARRHRLALADIWLDGLFEDSLIDWLSCHIFNPDELGLPYCQSSAADGAADSSVRDEDGKQKSVSGTPPPRKMVKRRRVRRDQY
jgi:hypothetical protein